MSVQPIERNDHAEPGAEAFIFGFAETNDGAIKPLTWDEVRNLDACPGGRWRWLHFNRLAPETRDWLEQKSDLDDTVVGALLQTETRPRCVAHDNGLLINFRGVNHNPGAEPEDMISVRIWATPQLVVSMRSYPVRAIREVREEIARDGATSTGDVLVRIAAKLVDNIEPIIDQLKEDADEYEDRLLSGRNRLATSELAEFRQSILLLRRYIQPQREAMAQMSRDSRGMINAEDAVYLREIGDRITIIAEELDSVRDRAAVLQDQIAGQRQETLNQRLLVLSIISALFLPLTFLTGLLGMNVAGIPYAHEPWAFAAVTGGAFVIALALIAYFKTRHWI